MGKFFLRKEGKENWGIINDKGDIVVKPSSKLKSIGTINGDVFTYNNGDGWGLMNIKGETLIRAKYEFLYYDKDCKQIEGLPDIVNIGTYEGESYIESDYVDLEKLVASFSIKDNGVLGFSMTSSPKEVAKKAAELNSVSGDKEHPAGTPYWFDYTNNITLTKDINGVKADISNISYGYLNELFPDKNKIDADTVEVDTVADY